jgi:integrase/recombinase XerC
MLRQIAEMNVNEILIMADPALLAERKLWLDGLAHERRLSDLTVEAYERDTRQFLLFLSGHAGGPARLSDIKALRPADLRAFLASRRKDGVGARTLGRSLAGLRSFLRFLEKKGMVNAAGSRAVRSPKQPKSLPKPLSAEQALLVSSDAGQLAEEPWISARNAAILTLLYGSGLRISEALGLTRNDVPENASSLRITGKGNKTRIVPLLAAAREAIAAYLKTCPFAIDADAPLFRRCARRAAAAGDHPARNAEDAVGPRSAGNGDAACTASLFCHASVCRLAAIFAPSRNCSAMPACRPRRSIPASMPPACSTSSRGRIRAPVNHIG